MKRFLLFVNMQKDRAGETSAFVRDYLLSRGAERADFTGSLNAEQIAGISQYDCIITLGGDGTMIRAARLIAGSTLPIAGINLGHLGYLTLISETEEIPMLLDALLSDRFSTEERMMLEGRHYSGNGAELFPVSPGSFPEIYLALNEIVVSRKNSGGPVVFSALVNGAFLNEYKADGIIISTPTGSTAYNLSAGGPIVDPSARMTILTPICPHALNRSSIVLKAEDTLEILIPETAPGPQSAAYDGAVFRDLPPGSRIRITESAYRTRLVRLEDETFFSRVRSKLRAF